MISNMSEDIPSINKDMNFACGTLEELRNNLENNRKSNAKQESYQSQTQETEFLLVIIKQADVQFI